jgi:hypothetical protein
VHPMIMMMPGVASPDRDGPSHRDGLGHPFFSRPTGHTKHLASEKLA